MRTDEETAWLAGLLEGEAFFGTIRPGRGRKPTPRVQLAMCDRDVVERAQRIAGTTANIFEQKTSAGNPVYCLYLGAEDSVSLMWRVLPFMGARRTEAILRTIADYYESRMSTCTVCGREFSRRRKSHGKWCAQCEPAKVKRDRARHA